VGIRHKVFESFFLFLIPELKSAGRPRKEVKLDVLFVILNRLIIWVSSSAPLLD
jgi:hypothetical protein